MEQNIVGVTLVVQNFLIGLALGLSARPRFGPKPITKFTLRHPPPQELLKVSYA